MTDGQTTGTTERGATIVMVAGALMLIVGMAALVVDISAGFNERRGDQSVADTAALAGVIQVVATQSSQGIVDSVLTIARQNLDATYSNAEWQTMWAGCADPGKNTGGFRYTSLPAPSGWAVTSLDCISLDPRGFLRVRVPDQITDTTFGRALGVDEITTSAVATARINDRLSGGILPFGLPSTVSGGDHACLTSTSGGNAQPPCTGPSAGNFGTLKGRRYGDLDLVIPENCNASPLGEVLAINIAAGYDHPVLPWKAADGTVEDRCYNFGVNTLNTDTGFPNAGAAEGLATGPLPYGLTPRLQQGSNPKRSVTTYNLDDRPLWYYLNGSGPAVCSPATFDNALNGDQDWNLDGTLDRPASWEHMGACLGAWTAAHGVIFSQSLETSPRFSWVPQFTTPNLGNGNSWLPVQSFKPIFIQGTWWKRGNNWIEFHPGETCTGCNGNGYAMQQMTAFILPDLALPERLRGDPAPGTTINPYRVELYR